MAFYLVARWTEAGLKKIKEDAHRKWEASSSRLPFRLYDDGENSKGIWCVTSKPFDAPEDIRAYYEANKSEFYGGLKSQEWLDWFKETESPTHVFLPGGLSEVFFVPVDVYDNLPQNKFKKRIYP